MFFYLIQTGYSQWKHDTTYRKWHKSNELWSHNRGRYGVPTASILEQTDHGWFQSNRRYIAVHTQVHSSIRILTWYHWVSEAANRQRKPKLPCSWIFTNCINSLSNNLNVSSVFKLCHMYWLSSKEKYKLWQSFTISHLLIIFKFYLAK